MDAPRVFTVVDRREEIPATVTLRIEPADGQAIPAFAPGQFNMLYGFGTGEVPISFSGAMDDGDGYTHTIRAAGKATEALTQLERGDQLGVRGPFGRGWPMAALAGKHIVVIAGGIGLAPLQPVLEHLVAHRDQFAGVQLFYGGKRPQELLYASRLDHWRQHIDLQISVDSADSGWSGHIGVVTQPLAAASFPAADTVALVCGPEIMMRFTLQTLQSQGVPDRHIYVSMERNMHCAIGHCGHCQWGPNFVCKDGPVFCYADIAQWFYRREL